ncbi:Poly(A) polymerase [hydrothermal vent metagenome]|uniref:Poly(A) polymerase n=1 Tax=hydrothermal vent metagenome TaxID=652676 RepID=A0A3B0ZCF4_9ZZZZ
MFGQVKSLMRRVFAKADSAESSLPQIISRDHHGISRSNISENALKVLYRLNSAGYEAYLVGGGVRDLLLGREPKDFDVATDASPEEVKKVFRNCRLIGRRFRLAHIYFGREIIEVATFRGDGRGDRRSKDGLLVRDNVYGTLEEDAWRRDFTINSLYYEVKTFSVIDHVGAMADIEAGRLHIIGDAVERYREDPVRMLRAVRFSSKLGFVISEETSKPIFECAPLMESVSSARLFDEMCKLFLHGYALTTYEQLRHYGLFGYLFPLVEKSLEQQDHDYPKTFIARGLENTDLRVSENKPVIPGFLLAVLLWEPVRSLVAQKGERGIRLMQAYQEAADEVISQQVKSISMPRRVSLQVKEIWIMQAKLSMRRGKKVFELLESNRFRAAFDFLRLRHQSGEEVSELYEWWNVFHQTDYDEQENMLSELRHHQEQNGPGRRSRRRNPYRRRRPQTEIKSE